MTGNAEYARLVNEWLQGTVTTLQGTFPTDLEANLLLHTPSNAGRVDYIGVDQLWGRRKARMAEFLTLNSILEKNLARYTDLPAHLRLFVEDIDSFAKVRDVNPSAIANHLRDGYFDRPEDEVQLALEAILDVPMHKRDRGGEENDLYTANVVLQSTRVPTAFMFKGNGLRKNVLEIRDCGRNGDQLVRLVQSPARLFVVQFVGEVSENVIKDIEGKVRDLRNRGAEACYCIINGQDTARVMVAYGKL